MSELRKKRVIRHGEEIGEATTWREVEELLVARGISRRQAQVECTTLRVEGREEFHIVTPAALDEMLAETRRIVASRNV